MFKALKRRKGGRSSSHAPWPELDDFKIGDIVGVSGNQRIRDARAKLDASGFQIERSDIPGFQKTMVLRSREILLFCGMTDAGRRVSFSAEMKKPYSRDKYDLTAKALSAFQAYQGGQQDPAGLFEGIEVSDWLFTANSQLGALIQNQVGRTLELAKLGPSVTLETSLYSATRARINRKLEPIRQEMIDLHSQDLQQIFNEKRMPADSQSIAWLTVPPVVIQTPSGPKAIEPRKDAVKQVAWLGACINPTDVGPFSVFPDGPKRLEALTDGIDAGKSVVELLAQTIGVRKQLVKHLKDVRAHEIALHGGQIIDNLCKLNVIPRPEHIETTSDGIFDALKMVEAQQSYTLVTGRDLKSEEGRDSIEKIAKAIGNEPHGGLIDMRNYLRDRLVVPAFWHIERDRGLSADAAALEARAHTLDHHFLQNFTMSQAYRAKADWHSRLPGINNRTKQEDQNQTWDAMRGDLDLGGGITAEEITSTFGLKEEGDLQSNCVGGYTDNVLIGQSVVYSIRRGKEVLSTVEISGRDNNDLRTGFEIKQNLSKGNAEPGGDAIDAAEQLIGQLERQPATMTSEYLVGLKKERDTRRGRSDFEILCMDAAGYDVSDKRKVEELFAELSLFLPKAQARKGFKAWALAEYEAAGGHPGPKPHKRDNPAR